MKQRVSCVMCGKDLGVQEVFLFEMSACRECAAKNNRKFRNDMIERNRKIKNSVTAEGLVDLDELELYPVPPITVIPEEFRIPEDYEYDKEVNNG